MSLGHTGASVRALRGASAPTSALLSLIDVAGDVQCSRLCRVGVAVKHGARLHLDVRSVGAQQTTLFPRPLACEQSSSTPRPLIKAKGSVRHLTNDDIQHENTKFVAAKQVQAVELGADAFRRHVTISRLRGIARSRSAWCDAIRVPGRVDMKVRILGVDIA